MSNDFYSFATTLSTLGKDEVLNYIDNFFLPENLPDYTYPDYVNDREKAAIEVMFDEDLTLEERILKAKEIDRFCIEAFFTELSMREETLAYSLFREYEEEFASISELDRYGRENLLIILDLFVEYLIEIRNYKTAIRLQIKINEKGEENANYVRLSYLYSFIEDSDAFYKLYLDGKVKDPACFLLLIITLLKNEEEDKAKDVLNDMFITVPYSDHIDRIWELDTSIPEAAVFADCVDRLFDELCSVPYFFSWCAQNKEEALHA